MNSTQQVYWKIEITDEQGNTTTIQRKKERKTKKEERTIYLIYNSYRGLKTDVKMICLKKIGT